MKHLRGFTLTELMIVIVVLAVLVSIAVPAMQSVLENRRLVGAAEALQGQMVLARSLAMQQSRPAYLLTVNSNGAWLAGIALANDANDPDRGWVPNALTRVGTVCTATDGTTQVVSNNPASGTIRCLPGTDYPNVVLMDGDGDPLPALTVLRFDPIRGTFRTADGGQAATGRIDVAIHGREAFYSVRVSAIGRVSLCSFGGSGRYSQCL